jgi:pumilio RNA-binding family
MSAFLAEVMSNQFGNYLCQKIIEVSKEHDLRLIVNTISTHIFDISTSIHGTRAMQTLAEVLSQHSVSLYKELEIVITQMNE